MRRKETSEGTIGLMLAEWLPSYPAAKSISEMVSHFGLTYNQVLHTIMSWRAEMPICEDEGYYCFVDEKSKHEFIKEMKRRSIAYGRARDKKVSG